MYLTSEVVTKIPKVGNSAEWAPFERHPPSTYVFTAKNGAGGGFESFLPWTKRKRIAPKNEDGGGEKRRRHTKEEEEEKG